MCDNPSSEFGLDSQYSDLGVSSTSAPETPLSTSINSDSGYESETETPVEINTIDSELSSPFSAATEDNDDDDEVDEENDEEDYVTAISSSKTQEPSAQIEPTPSTSNALTISTKKAGFPSVRELLVSGAINCILPFINGMMLGFGEIFAHELGFRWGWTAARVS